MSELFATSTMKGADLSPCRHYRYYLWREWKPGPLDRRVLFIGLNPSTADENEDDPTIRRCINFAKSWGYDGIGMVNAFAFRATEPKDMLAADDPIGPINDRVLRESIASHGLVVAAWGANCPAERQAEVMQLFSRTVYCLGQTKHGFPKHPLYLKKTTELIEFGGDQSQHAVAGVVG